MTAAAVTKTMTSSGLSTRDSSSDNDDDDNNNSTKQRADLIDKILTPAYVNSSTTSTTATSESENANNADTDSSNNSSITHQQQQQEKENHVLEIVLLVAPPACGKSTLARSLFVNRLGYVRINRDTLGNMEKCIQQARLALTGGSGISGSDKRGESVVVDNTNTELHQRGLWVQLARELNIPIRCVCIETTLGVALSLQQLRLLSPDAVDVSERREIPEWVIEKFFKEYRAPQLTEGFARIDKIPFVLDENASSHPITKRLYESYL